MLRRTIYLALILVFVLAGGAFAASEKKDTITVIDRAGRQVQVPKDVKRIVSVPVVYPPMIYAIDGTGKRIVGMHPMTKGAVKNSVLSIMAPELLEVSTGFVKGGFKVNIEELVKLKPEVVLQKRSEKQEIEKIEAVGIPVIVTHGGQLNEHYIASMKIFGRMLNKEKRAQELISIFQESIKTIGSRTKDIPKEKRPKGLILFDVERLMATGRGSFAEFWLKTTGAVNVANDIKTSPRGATVNMEQVLVWNPDIIYITNFCETQPEDILNNRIKGQNWSKVKAVQEGRVYKIPLGEYRWYPPSGDSALMLKWMAQKNHPGLFNDYDIKDEIKNHFMNIYNFNLTDAQVERVLHPMPTGKFRW